MSRIGKKPVVLPDGVTVDIKNDSELTVKGAKGELSQTFRPEVALKLSEEILRKNPENTNCSYLRGMLLYNKGDYTAAVSNLKKSYIYSNLYHIYL